MCHNFLLGKKHRVIFENNRIVEVKFWGGKIPRFQRLNDNTIIEGTEWLNGAKKVVLIEDSDE